MFNVCFLINANLDFFVLNQLVLSNIYIIYEFTNFLVAARLPTVHIHVVKKILADTLKAKNQRHYFQILTLRWLAK